MKNIDDNIDELVEMSKGQSELNNKSHREGVMIDEAGELLSPSGVKALSANTLVSLSDGTRKLLRDIAEGDVILDSKGEPTTVIDKYEPERQVHPSGQ